MKALAKFSLSFVVNTVSSTSNTVSTALVVTLGPSSKKLKVPSISRSALAVSPSLSVAVAVNVIALLINAEASL